MDINKLQAIVYNIFDLFKKINAERGLTKYKKMFW